MQRAATAKRLVNAAGKTIVIALLAGLHAAMLGAAERPGHEQEAPPAITLKLLLDELCDPAAHARLPEPAYESLQNSSYNRLSTRRDQPEQDTRGWFADSDGLGFLRTEPIKGQTEWVMMEHEGPGVITKIWTPYFYYGFNDMVGPSIRIYLDGGEAPVIDEPLIPLVLGKGSVTTAPFAAATARAGNLYLPIPFAKRCKVTMTRKPFYNIINYRAYSAGTRVETFKPGDLQATAAELEQAAAKLYAAKEPETGKPLVDSFRLAAGESKRIELPQGPAAVAWLRIKAVPAAAGDTSHLRSTVLSMRCGDDETIWAPLGDFFSCADSIHPYHTWQRSVAEDGTLTCRWPMPYPDKAQLAFTNFGKQPVSIKLALGVDAWQWDDRSLQFFARWRPDDFVQGSEFQDWNFVDIRGAGVFVGDSWTVLNPTHGWWGEGDEKIYVDGAWEQGFPTHFGTGTEDYYGWAGGRNPTREDEFDEPFLANVRVGGQESQTTRGYNICVRTRGLDAIPFAEHLRFDMEASAGTSQRRPSDWLGYSVVTFWYARPGAEHNRPARPEAAARPIMSLADLAARATGAAHRSPISEGVEFELLEPTATSPGLSAGPQRPAESFDPRQWSGSAHSFVAATKPGDFVEFALTEQFNPADLMLLVTTSYDFGIVRVSVNGKPVVERLDLSSDRPAVKKVDLGRHEPTSNAFVIRCELVAPSPRGRGAKTYFGLDSVIIEAIGE
jgi:hypothetical protein